MIFVSKTQVLEELLRSLAAGDPDSLARMKSHLECLRGDGPPYPTPSDITVQLLTRDAHGQRKYGTSLDRTDLTLGDWLQHQAEELMDGAGYALAAKREYERLQQDSDDLRHIKNALDHYPGLNSQQLQARAVCSGVLKLAKQYSEDGK